MMFSLAFLGLCGCAVATAPRPQPAEVCSPPQENADRGNLLIQVQQVRSPSSFRVLKTNRTSGDVSMGASSGRYPYTRFLDTNRTPGPVNVSMDASAFIAELEPCARKLFDKSMPPREDPEVPGIDAVFVVHGTMLHERLERLKDTLPAHGIHKWTTLDAFDGPKLSPDDISCLFGQVDVNHSAILNGPNHLSSVAKPHLAYYAVVKEGLRNALVIEDDVYFNSDNVDLKAELASLAAQMPACDIIQIGPLAIGYLISNGGARKMLTALRAGQEKLKNPADWQMDYVESKVTNFNRCHRDFMFTGDGHGSNHY